MTNNQRPQAIEVRGARVHNLQEHRHRHSAGRTGGRGRRLGFGQELAGARRAVCGRFAALPRGAVHVHAPPPDPGGSRPAWTRYCTCRRRWPCTSGPRVPGVRSTFGTMTELLNSLRLLFSRCARHVCPHCGAAQRVDAQRGGRTCPSPVPGVRRGILRARRRGARVQLRPAPARPAPARALCARWTVRPWCPTSRSRIDEGAVQALGLASCGTL